MNRGILKNPTLCGAKNSNKVRVPNHLVTWISHTVKGTDTLAEGAIIITKTCLHNFDPLKPHIYLVKLGFTVVYIIFFLFLLKNIDCGYSLELPHLGGSNEYPQSMF